MSLESDAIKLAINTQSPVEVHRDGSKVDIFVHKKPIVHWAIEGDSDLFCATHDVEVLPKVDKPK